MFLLNLQYFSYKCLFCNFKEQHSVAETALGSAQNGLFHLLGEISEHVSLSVKRG